jgi:hypothetical protein
MYLTGQASFGEPEPGQIRPGQTLPYREALEQTERRQQEEYERDCRGINLPETLERIELSPLERVQRAERVLRFLPELFRLKRDAAERVRAGRMPRREADALTDGYLRRMGYPAGYALSSEPDELARARCALSKARWEFMVYQGTGRVPGRLLRPRLGQAPGPAQPAPPPQCVNPLDARAQAIITAAQNQSVPLADRAVQAVQNIIRTYYASQAGKVTNVLYNESTPGLVTQRSGWGPGATGVITVGRYFVERIANFARRVLQTGHELVHIEQYRQNMTDQTEREFLAHCWTALMPELPGTGCVQRGDRLGSADCAFRFYNCLSAQKQTQYAQHRQTLLNLRQSLQASTPIPAGCSRDEIRQTC